MISRRLLGISFIAITWNPESNCTCREKNHFLFRWSISSLAEPQIHHWMYCWKNILMITGTWMEIVNCQILGPDSQDLQYWKRKPSDDFSWCWEKLTRKQTTSRPEKFWPEMWKHMSDASKRKEKQKWAIEKPKLDDARSLRGIYVIDPKDKEFHDMMKNARRKLEIPMPAAMLANCNVTSTGKPVAQLKNTRQNLLVDESTRIRLEGVPDRHHEDQLAAKGINSPSHYNLVHKFIPMPQALNIPDAKVAVEK